MTELQIAGTRVHLTRGDITEANTAAIVNAANSSLLGGGGVDGAIHSKGGPMILEECQRLRASRYPDGLPTGGAVATGGGALAARSVIHAVGPIWRGGDHGEDVELERAYVSALTVALEEGLESVAFPSISTGAYRFPLDRAARIALRAVIGFVRLHPQVFTEIRFVLFSATDERAYAEALAAHGPVA
ncbi:MAG TPA: O-acetyl-ADP-ribose deacetylase [Longimicrobiales bacterium]|nr:O-acetyl-ADP-ribose deacetylase [Longimicrobiales bacterium]